MRGTIGSILFLILVWVGSAAGHAFLDHAEPKVGSTVSAPPAVKIWFDSPIEPAFSSLDLFQQERKINRVAARVEEENLLIVDLPPLDPGSYQVKWKVLAKDGHVTEGEFDFNVR